MIPEPKPSGAPIPPSEINPSAGTPPLPENRGGYEAKVFGEMPQVDVSVLQEDFSYMDVPVAQRATEWTEKQVAALKRIQDESVVTPDGELSVRARYETEFIHGEPSRLKTRALQNWLKDPANRYEPTDDVARAAKVYAIRIIKSLPGKYVQQEGREELLRRYEAAYYRTSNIRQPEEAVQRDRDLMDSAKRYGESSTDSARRNNAFLRLQKKEDIVRRYEVAYINDALSEKYRKTVETPQFVRYEATPTIKKAARKNAEREVAFLKTNDLEYFSKLVSQADGEDNLIKRYEAQFLRGYQFYDDADTIYNPNKERYEPRYEPAPKYEAK